MVWKSAVQMDKGVILARRQAARKCILQCHARRDERLSPGIISNLALIVW
jgi:hypothetical protein